MWSSRSYILYYYTRSTLLLYCIVMRTITGNSRRGCHRKSEMKKPAHNASPSPHHRIILLNCDIEVTVTFKAIIVRFPSLHKYLIYHLPAAVGLGSVRIKTWSFWLLDVPNHSNIGTHSYIDIWHIVYYTIYIEITLDKMLTRSQCPPH